MKVNVVSSTQEIYSTDDALEVYAPTSAGIVGILKDHANYIAPLQIGELRIKQKDTTERIFLNGGIIQVIDNDIMVLADEATKAADIIKDEVEQAITNAQKKLAAPLEPAELIKLEKLLRYEKFKQQHLEG